MVGGRAAVAGPGEGGGGRGSRPAAASLHHRLLLLLPALSNMHDDCTFLQLPVKGGKGGYREKYALADANRAAVGG